MQKKLYPVPNGPGHRTNHSEDVWARVERVHLGEDGLDEDGLAGDGHRSLALSERDAWLVQ